MSKLLAELNTISLFDAFRHYICKQKINNHALCALKKENYANYWFEIFYAWAVIETLQSIKTSWHYFWWEEIRLDTFWTDLVSSN